MITKYRWTANTPRAHITNQRTMEIFRDLGIEDAGAGRGDAARVHGRHRVLHVDRGRGDRPHPARGARTRPAHADYQLASPSLNCDIPQTYLEPILVRNAAAARHPDPFSTEYLSHVQDADGVTVQVRDRLTGVEYEIRAKYLIGADGARSRVAADLDLPMEGQMDIAGSMNITFTADLEPRRATARRCCTG